MRNDQTVVLASAFLACGFTSPAMSAQSGTVDRGKRVTLIGCVVQASDGAFELTNATFALAARRSSGSSSAKASTPIGQAVPSADRPRTSGTTTPKGSTPVGVAPARLESSTTNGVNSPKASTPVRRTQTSAYALDAQAVSSHVGQLVEIAGALQPQRVLRVETIRPLAASCMP